MIRLPSSGLVWMASDGASTTGWGLATPGSPSATGQANRPGSSEARRCSGSSHGERADANAPGVERHNRSRTGGSSRLRRLEAVWDTSQ